MQGPPDDERAPTDAIDRTARLLPARLIGGKYRLGRMIGEGGMGAVYEAEHVELGMTVAIKLLSHAIANDPKALARFRREARATAAIKHDNIVLVTDAGADERGPFIVMELLQGESLSSVLHRERVLEPAVAVAITQQILAGLVAAHDQKIIHRDLKPANVILVTAGGATRVKILDFGISKFFSEPEIAGVTMTGELVGTPRFMSPEQASASPDVDHRADLYAVAEMLYLMVTGKYPHP